MAISNILKDIRVERNLIQEDLAEATGSYQPKMKEFSGATPVSVEQEFYINARFGSIPIECLSALISTSTSFACKKDLL